MENMDVFAVVVEQRSINRASALLNLSQPAVSRKIMSLEEELGVQLFERIGKRLSLTRAGQVCYEHAVQMRRLERDLMLTIGRMKDSRAPLNLTVGASLTTLQSTLPDLITAYTAAFPDTDITALTGKTHEIISLVKEKKVDFGLVASRVDHPGIHSVPLFDDHLCLVLPALHPLLEVAAPSMNDLNGLPMILFSRGTWYRVLMDDIFQRNGVHPDVKMEIDSFEAIIRLVPSIRAATLLPMSYLRRELLADNDLQVRQLAGLEETKRTTSLIYTEEAARSASILAFVDKAKTYYSAKSGQE